MTDFREYSAAFIDHQDALMHYGVKGMKWHKHLKAFIDNAKYHLKYDVGIGLKKDIKNDQDAINRIAKSEIRERQTPEDGVSYTDKHTGLIRKGDRHAYNANELKNMRLDTQHHRNYLKGMYNTSAIGKVENFINNFFKKKKKK